MMPRIRLLVGAALVSFIGSVALALVTTTTFTANQSPCPPGGIVRCVVPPHVNDVSLTHPLLLESAGLLALAIGLLIAALVTARARHTPTVGA